MTDALLGRLLAVHLREAPFFFGIFDYQTLRPLFINQAGLSMLDIQSLDDYLIRYPFGFQNEPLSATDFHVRFDLMLEKGAWEGNIECRQHTGQMFWVWLYMKMTTLNENRFLFIRAMDVLFLRDLSQKALPTDAVSLVFLIQNRTNALLATLHELALTKKALENSQQLERSLDTRKNEFITAISHEFRTPLAILSTSATLLSKQAINPEKQQQYGHAILQQIQHLTELLETLANQTLLGESSLSAEHIYQTATDLKDKRL